MNEVTHMTLRACFVADDSERRRGFIGARCELPNGRVVEITSQRSPLYAMARKLEAMGFADRKLQAYTPTGAPSLRGKVSVMAGLRVEESDTHGLCLRKFVPFPSAGVAKDAQVGLEGTENHWRKPKRAGASHWGARKRHRVKGRRFERHRRDIIVPRQCTICAHKKRPAIDKALVARQRFGT